MRINKRVWRISGAVLGIAAITTSATVLFWPETIKASSTYSLQFNSDVEDYAAKNDYIVTQQTKTADLISDYKTTNSYDGNLRFNYTNLSSSQSTGELNFYQALDKTMKNISPSLGINNRLRTPVTVAEGFYNKDTELLSFYWSPDYNGVGTWMAYMFTETYTFANMYYPLYEILKEGFAGGNGIDTTTYPWAQELFGYLKDKPNPITGSEAEGSSILLDPIEIYNLVHSAQNLEVLPQWKKDDDGKDTNIPVTDAKGNQIVNAAPKVAIDDYYTAIANYLGAWTKKLSKPAIRINKDTGVKEYDIWVPEAYGIQFVNWLAASNPNLPFVEEGPNTSIPMLTTQGFYNQANSNTDTNYRDWYIRDGSETIDIWLQGDPFMANKTPWSPNFSQAPNSAYAQSLWTGLTSWTTTGDANDTTTDKDDNEISNDSTPLLVSNAIMEDISVGTELDELRDQLNSTDKKLTVTIRPIPWVDTNGQHVVDGDGNLAYLSPVDFIAGLEAFQKSIKVGVNANNAYFNALSGLDMPKTIENFRTKQKNGDPSTTRNGKDDTQPLELYFDTPILDITDILDILQKQYFNAIPEWHPKVQNILKLSDSKDEWKDDYYTTLYGAGGVNDSWKDLYFAAPYRISNVNEQQIVYELNESYFEAFKDVQKKAAYESFNLTSENGNKKRIKKLNVKYGGSYSDSILYEQFKSGEVDLSPIPTAFINSSYKLYPNNIRNIKTEKLNQSNVVSFNTKIYQTHSESSSEIPKLDDGTPTRAPVTNVIIDSNTGEPMFDYTTGKLDYWLDEYGNYVFPEGTKPALKPQVSEIYADLIVADYHTPEADGGTSKTIRGTLVNTINWASIKSLYTPGIDQSIQYSFMPYGVYRFDNGLDLDNPDWQQGSYWDMAANKNFYDSTNSNSFDPNSRALQTGNMIWTYDDLIQSQIKE